MTALSLGVDRLAGGSVDFFTLVLREGPVHAVVGCGVCRVSAVRVFWGLPSLKAVLTPLFFLARPGCSSGSVLLSWMCIMDGVMDWMFLARGYHSRCMWGTNQAALGSSGRVSAFAARLGDITCLSLRYHQKYKRPPFGVGKRLSS